MLRLIFIKKYEMISLSRWGWHTFRLKGKIVGFRFLGIGILWDKWAEGGYVSKDFKFFR